MFPLGVDPSVYSHISTLCCFPHSNIFISLDSHDVKADDNAHHSSAILFISAGPKPQSLRQSVRRSRHVLPQWMSYVSPCPPHRFHTDFTSVSNWLAGAKKQSKSWSDQAGDVRPEAGVCPTRPHRAAGKVSNQPGNPNSVSCS